MCGLYFSIKYKHSPNFDFLKNTHVTTLGLWNNSLYVQNNKFVDLCSNIPKNIHTLQLMFLSEPLSNIPSTIQKIKIFLKPKKELILKSKIPCNCEIFYGLDMQKYIM